MDQHCCLASPLAHVGLTVREQSKNESMFHQKLQSLGGTVDWDIGFESLEMKDTRAIGTLTDVSRLETGWVVVCDGARSPVSHACGLEFVCRTYYATFYVANVDVEDFRVFR